MDDYLELLKKHRPELSLTILGGNLVFAGVNYILFFSLAKYVEIGAETDINITLPSFIFLAVTLLAGSFQSTILIASTIEKVTAHRDTGMFLAKGFWKMSSILFLIYLINCIPMIVFFLLYFYGFPFRDGMIYFLMLLQLTWPIVANPPFMHAPIILIAEDTSIMQALSKSFYLFRKSFSHVRLSASLTLPVYIPFILTTTFSALPFLLFILVGYLGDLSLLHCVYISSIPCDGNSNARLSLLRVLAPLHLSR